jgi:hypothetical protein
MHHAGMQLWNNILLFHPHPPLKYVFLSYDTIFFNFFDSLCPTNLLHLKQYACSHYFWSLDWPVLSYIGPMFAIICFCSASSIGLRWPYNCRKSRAAWVICKSINFSVGYVCVSAFAKHVFDPRKLSLLGFCLLFSDHNNRVTYFTSHAARSIEQIGPV